MNDSRRRLLRLLAATATLAACGGPSLDRESILARARELDTDLACDDTTGLWPAEVATRKDNAYVDHSTEELSFCFNCANFTEAGDDGCGSCRTVKGPIHPGGWCKSWTEKRG